MSSNVEMAIRNALGFAQMDPGAYESLLSELKSLPLSLDTNQEIFELVADHTAGQNESGGQDSEDQFVLFALYKFADRGDDTLAKVIARLLDDVNEELSEEITETECEILKSRLGELAEAHTVISSIKAGILMAEREKILAESQVITDIRPVLGDEFDTNLSVVIINSLKLEYFENRMKKKTVHIALDEEDIEKLIADLTRAQRKIRSFKDSFRTANFTVIE